MSGTLLTNDPELKSFSASAGTLLRQAREAAGMHIGALAVSLKVPVKKIEALEADRLDLLPDAVFARALASSICRTLKVDGALVLAALPRGQLPRLKTDESSLNTAYHGSGVTAPSTVALHLSKPLVLIGLALVAGAAFLLIAPGQEASGPAKQPELAQSPASNLLPTPVLAASAASVPGNAESVQSPAVEVKSPEKTELASASAATEPGKVADTGPETGPITADGTIVFSAKGVSWVEVTDGAGVVQLRKTLSVGEIAGASGKSPFKVIVGRVDSVGVKIRGKEFDLNAVSRDNVARFEVR